MYRSRDNKKTNNRVLFIKDLQWVISWALLAYKAIDELDSNRERIVSAVFEY